MLSSRQLMLVSFEVEIDLDLKIVCLACKIICLLYAILSWLQPLENPSVCGRVAEHFPRRALRLELVPACPKIALSRKYLHKHFRKQCLILGTHEETPLSISEVWTDTNQSTQQIRNPSTRHMILALWGSESETEYQSFADWRATEKLSCHQPSQLLTRSQITTVTVYVSFLQLHSPGCTWFALAPLRAGTEVAHIWCERLHGNTPRVVWHKTKSAAPITGEPRNTFLSWKG